MPKIYATICVLLAMAALGLAQQATRRPAVLPETLAASSSAPASQATSAPASQATSAPASAPSTLPAEAVGLMKDYRMILERNIFSRTRSSSQTGSTAATTQSSSQPSQREVVLIGVTVRDEVVLAWLEDSRSGELIMAVVGSVLENGTVTGISLDGLEFRTRESVRKVAVGETLSGQVTTLGPGSTTASAGGGTSTSTSASSSSSPAGSESDILQKMRQRRLQELKR